MQNLMAVLTLFGIKLRQLMQKVVWSQRLAMPQKARLTRIQTKTVSHITISSLLCEPKLSLQTAKSFIGYSKCEILGAKRSLQVHGPMHQILGPKISRIRQDGKMPTMVDFSCRSKTFSSRWSNPSTAGILLIGSIVSTQCLTT